MVKDASTLINDSPWAALAATPAWQPPLDAVAAANAGTGPVTVAHIPPQFAQQHQHPSRTGLYTPTSSAGTPTHAKPRQSLSLATRGSVPPPNPLDPQSATSVHSMSNGIIGSGYQTPLPATPMSAALGPAAIATVPAPQHMPAAMAGGLSQPSLAAPAVPPHNGLFTPTLPYTPSPGLGVSIPPLGLNSSANNLISPTMQNTISAASMNPAQLVSPSLPPHVAQTHQYPPPTYGGHYSNTSSGNTSSTERTPTQQSHGFGVMERTRSVSQRR